MFKRTKILAPWLMLCLLLGTGVFLALMPTGCKTGGLPPVVSDGVASTVDCAVASVAEIAKDNITSVELDLLQDNWKSILATDAVKLGKDVLACIVEYIVSRSRLDASRAASDVNSRNKTTRGDLWLADQKVQFSSRLKQ